MRRRAHDSSLLPPTRRAGLVAVAAVAAISFALSPVATVSADTGSYSDGRSSYTPITPCRLTDSRDILQQGDRVDAATIRVHAAGRCGLGTDMSAVAVTITVTNTTGNGFAAITPTQQPGPTSTVNWSDGETRAASTVVGVSSDGVIYVRVSNSFAAQAIIVDVSGFWTRTTGPYSAGRLITIPGHRAVDTRVGNGPVNAGASITLDRAALGIPMSATAVSGTLTSAGADGPGFLTAYPAGTPVPVASNVNTDRAGQSRAAGIITALGDRGLSIYAGAAATGIILDVTGYVTGTGDPVSTAGLLIAVTPKRILDTRDTAPAVLTAVTNVDLPFPGGQIGGVIATVTATDATLPGFATLTAVGSPSTEASQTSALNWSGNPGAVAAMTIQTVSAANELQVNSPVPASFIVDVTGYLLAANAPAGPEVPEVGGSLLTRGVIDDRTGTGQLNGDPIVLLRQTYTANQLAAAGAVSIVRTELDGPPAMVPNDVTAFPACSPDPICVLLAPSSWDRVRVDADDANRVMIAHEFGHVLVIRYEQWMGNTALATWNPRHAAVNEECLADAVAATTLERAGQPGNETANYIVHYMCDQFWIDTFGADRLDEMQTEAASLATDLLDWAEGWGSTHP